MLCLVLGRLVASQSIRLPMQKLASQMVFFELVQVFNRVGEDVHIKMQGNSHNSF